MSELAILLARALSIFQQVYSLLFFNKFKFTSFSASSSSLIIALLLLFKVIDSLRKAFSEKRWPKRSSNFGKRSSYFVSDIIKLSKLYNDKMF